LADLAIGRFDVLTIYRFGDISIFFNDIDFEIDIVLLCGNVIFIDNWICCER
jgi:hypothetical protein